VIRIPFNRPFATGDETLRTWRTAIATPKFSGDGSFHRGRCHRLLERSLGVQKGASHDVPARNALEMAALLLKPRAWETK